MIPVVSDAREVEGLLVGGPLVCPECGATLDQQDTGADCRTCVARYTRLEGGYLSLLPFSSITAETPSDDYLAEQVSHGAGRAERWLARQLMPDDRSALDVGCGTGSVGMSVAVLHPTLKVWGVDLPANLPGWKAAGADPQVVVAGSALDLPFESGWFDIAWSLGVLEHIGEPAPPSERGTDRLRYLSEMLRVVRPGGRVIILAPHKWFPLDPGHDWSRTERGHRFFERTHLSVHRTWGPHPLMSYGELRRMARDAGAVRVRPLSVADYFSFHRTGGGAAGWLVPAVRVYLKTLPVWLCATPLTPMLAVELTRANPG
jgi:SAM-dependent methyltransferase